MSGRPVVLFLSHILSPSILAEHRRLEAELGDACDVWLALDETRAAGRGGPQPPARVWRFTHRDLFDANPYPRKGANGRFHPGNVDLVLLRFFRDHAPADFYWLIEHDVRFTGRWPTLFDAVRASQADLVGTTLRRRSDVPDWRFWYTIDAPAGESLEPDAMVRGFFPIIRLSYRGLEALDASYRRGWIGHWEGAVPTILQARGLSLEDLGGRGEFVPPGRTDRFYTNTPEDPLLSPGTFVFRPIRDRAGLEPDRLYHPVKHRRDPTWTFRPWRDWYDRWRAARDRRRARSPSSAPTRHDVS